VETLKRVLFTVQDVNSKALKIDVASEMTSATLHSRLQQLSTSVTGCGLGGDGVPSGCVHPGCGPAGCSSAETTSYQSQADMLGILLKFECSL
jgi:hypothetical protein